MNPKFKITIPKPCHENWNTMSPREKGKFCSSCSKTVVDFTKKSKNEIQKYLVENKNVCGHFFKKQLDSVVIEIPEVSFEQKLSFQKLFVLALFFVMGTTLFSCQYNNGKKQKIDKIILVDSIQKIKSEIDSVSQKSNDCKTTDKKDSLIELTTVGDVVENYEIEGEITIDGDIDYEEVEEAIFGFVVIEETPRFKEAKNLSKVAAKKYFDKRIQNFVDENFDIKTTQNLGLKEGKHRIYTQFEIDKEGFVSEIKVRAPHPKLEKEVRKMFKKLPQFIPGKQDGKVVKTKYNLPILFIVE